MKKQKYSSIFLAITILIFLAGCKKDFLDARPSSTLTIPSTLEDLQLMLDDFSTLNLGPSIGEVSSDDYFIDSLGWSSLNDLKSRNLYAWKSDIFEGLGNVADWNIPYKQVLYANIVLEQLGQIKRDSTNQVMWDNLKGAALFIRANAFFNLAQIFSSPYDSSSSSSALGIPLRLTSDINVPTSRSSLQQTYDQIISDATHARFLLSVNFPAANRNRPSRCAAFSLLSRTFLSARAYNKAGDYADSALSLYSTLINYNSISQTSATPFTISNDETIYQSSSVQSDIITLLRASRGYSIDSTLYRSYSTNDLRRAIYFASNASYINRKRGYSGLALLFTGFAVDELYLTRAESYARRGNINAAMTDLNNLLKTRWRTGTYTLMTATSSSDALAKVLVERRKSLVMRGLRWIDIRRLNKEGYNIILKRILAGQLITIPANDPRYTLPIPPDVISASGISQNPR